MVGQVPPYRLIVLNLSGRARARRWTCSDRVRGRIDRQFLAAELVSTARTGRLIVPDQWS